MKRSIILVLDSFGIGATEDAVDFGDVGANTLGHIAQACARGEANNGDRSGASQRLCRHRPGGVSAHHGG